MGTRSTRSARAAKNGSAEKRSARRASASPPAADDVALARRLAELEMGAEARREEAEASERKLVSLESQVADLRRLAERVDECAARLDVMETGGLRQTIGRLLALEAVDRALLAPVAWETACGRALSIVAAEFRGSTAGLLLLDGDGSTLRLVSRHPASTLSAPGALKLVLSPSASQAFSELALRTAPCGQEAALLSALGRDSGATAGTAVSAPVVLGGRPRGVVSMLTAHDGPSAAEDRALFTEIAARIALAFEAEVTRRRAERQKEPAS